MTPIPTELRELMDDELRALAGQLRIVLFQEQHFLSCAQEEWAYDLVFSAEKQHWWRFTQKAIDFSIQVVRGDYKEDHYGKAISP